MEAPVLTYNYFSYGTMGPNATPQVTVLDHLPTEPIYLSFQPGFNSISIKYNPNMQLIYYEARITEIDADYGIGIGTRWYYDGPNIAGSTDHGYTLNVNSTYFPTPAGKQSPDGQYRIGLYAKGINGVWDIRYILISSDDYIMAPNDYSGIMILTDEPIPSA